jgi:hypothetical protein
VTSRCLVTSRDTPVSDLNLMFAVGRHGMPFGRSISISGHGLPDLITIGLSHRGIGQQQSNDNGNQDPDHLGFLQTITWPTAHEEDDDGQRGHARTDERSSVRVIAWSRMIAFPKDVITTIEGRCKNHTVPKKSQPIWPHGFDCKRADASAGRGLTGGGGEAWLLMASPAARHDTPPAT